MKKFLLLFFILAVSLTGSWGQITVNLDNSVNWIQESSTALTSYANHAYSESGVTIEGTNVLRNTTTAQDGFPGAIGTYSMRIGNTALSKVVITVSSGGVSSFSIKVRRWDGSPIPNYNVKISTDAGSSWSNLTNIDGTLLISSDWFTYSGAINDGNNNIKIEIANTGTTERIMIDDFTWTGYSSSEPTLTLSSASSLSESNLNGAELTLTLSNETFVASPQVSDFTLNNVPPGTSISGVSRNSDTEVVLTLDFDGSDFDSDIANFNVTAGAAALTGDSPITSNNLSIDAFSAPDAATNAATATLNGNAMLNGTVTANGYATSVSFEYGTDTNYGSVVTASQSPLVADASSAAVSASLTGLSNGQEYHYRVNATNTEGTAYGEDQTFTPIAPPALLITEVADPSDVANAKFVEIYNYSEQSIDLSALSVYLVKQSNGGTYSNIALSGTLASGNTFVVANNDDLFLEVFDKEADAYSGNVDGNGDDGYFLYVGGNQSTGTLFDAFGVPNEDGTGKSWEYTDGKAVRKTSVLTTNSTWTAEEWNIVNAATSRMSPGSYPASVWNGSSDADWSNDANWDNGLVSSSMDAYVWGGAVNFPDISSAVTVRNIVIQHNAQINGQENLTVIGTSTVNHQITQSTNNSTLDHWQYFTSPFISKNAGNLLSTNNKIDLYLAKYDNNLSETANDAWSFISSTSTALIPGTGFSITYVNDAGESGLTIAGTDYNLSFSGTLLDASSNAIVNLSQGLNNWNLIGNPYLAPLNWFDDTNLDFSLIQGNAAYVYNPASSSYITITSTGSGNGTVSPSSSELIPPLQGFFVEASGTGTFELDKDARVNTAQSFYKSETITPLLRIQVKMDSLMDETVLIYNEMAEQGFDPFDAHKLFTNGLSPQIFTTTKEHQLVFNQFNSFDETIDLQLVTKKAGTYQLEINEMAGLFNDYRVYLERAGSELVEITREGHTLEAGEGINNNHFKLSFQLKTGLDAKQDFPLKVFMNGQTLFIRSAKDMTGLVRISKLSGQRILDDQLKGQHAEYKLSNHSGMILVQVLTNKQASTYKFYVR